MILALVSVVAFWVSLGLAGVDSLAILGLVMLLIPVGLGAIVGVVGWIIGARGRGWTWLTGIAVGTLLGLFVALWYTLDLTPLYSWN